MGVIGVQVLECSGHEMYQLTVLTVTTSSCTDLRGGQLSLTLEGWKRRVIDSKDLHR